TAGTTDEFFHEPAAGNSLRRHHTDRSDANVAANDHFAQSGNAFRDYLAWDFAQGQRRESSLPGTAGPGRDRSGDGVCKFLAFSETTGMRSQISDLRSQNLRPQ